MVRRAPAAPPLVSRGAVTAARQAVEWRRRSATPAHQVEDPYDLTRFVKAQEPHYAQALAELNRGAKRSHWMWYIFPQLQGLGSSPTAVAFAIGSLAEARAYLAHPLLGPRLRECTQCVLALPECTARELFGYPDDLKFRSCMTLFAHADPAGPWRAALTRYFAGAEDSRTRELLT
jgi:uncharacterized protein (DUF1810 family)